jgi:2-succinyl-5-enolpyruvyl-6-hydroxy-3-cyclohexene-1-carboxylate synthase
MPADVPAASAARALVEALVVNGLRHVCITPGSRSTPLTAAFVRHPGIKPWLHLDERSSSFFALGLARALSEPVALVCTSGTAAANYLPAVVEANQSRIPLIVLTADRPPRLRDIGADQTIDQVGMFGRNVRWALDLPVPWGTDGEEDTFRAVAMRALRATLGPFPGPVHLNLPFDEPLIGDAGGQAELPDAAEVRALAHPAPQPPSPADLATVAMQLMEARRPLVVAGPETGGLPGAAIAKLAAKLGAPLLADPLSGVRTGAHDRSQLLDSYDAFIRDPRADSEPPDLVVRFGGVPTSKALNMFLRRCGARTHLLCDNASSWRDPETVVTHAVPGDPRLVAAGLESMFAETAADPAWLSGWLERDRLAREVMQAQAAGFDEPFEGRVFTELQAALPARATIVAGNSMPVRDLDSFLVSDAKPLRLVSNRGANGIDGVVSTALGHAAARLSPTVLVIGDLSFYHDLNGLWAARRHDLNLTVVLVNNEGGGIFHYLPQAAHGDIFEEWFGTPAGLDFSLAVRMYGGEHVDARGWDAFREAVAAPPQGLRVVELRTDRNRNTEMHRQAWAAAGNAAWEPAGVPR